MFFCKEINENEFEKAKCTKMVNFLNKKSSYFKDLYTWMNNKDDFDLEFQKEIVEEICEKNLQLHSIKFYSATPRSNPGYGYTVNMAFMFKQELQYDTVNAIFYTFYHDVFTDILEKNSNFKNSFQGQYQWTGCETKSGNSRYFLYYYRIYSEYNDFEEDISIL